jgi:hypothetical protein
MPVPLLDFLILICIMAGSLSCCLGGEIGRRKGLKIPRSNIRAGSTPAQGTTHRIEELTLRVSSFFLLSIFS